MEEEKILPEENEPKPLSNQKKTALLRYMAILFAVAFLMVLISFFVQESRSKEQIGKLSETSQSALTRAEQLQEENRQLQDSLDEANEALTDAQEQSEQLQDEIEAIQNEAESQRILYEALLTVATAKVKEGNVSYARAMETLRQNEPNMNNEIKAVYQSLLEE